MDPARWKQIKSVLAEVLAAPEGDRAEIVDRLCGVDTALVREVNEIRLADQEGGQTRARIEGVAADFIREGTLHEGDWLGPFQILREIGRGGMGIVYLAERQEPFRQRAAIKVIAPRHIGAHFTLAFARERQILASLEHPHIARVLHGGETDGGIHYLVMEYVEGRPLHRALDGLNDHALVDFLIAVCDAVAYAQARLVVHGDLKPDNILITAEGRVKLLDFGVAAMASEQAGFYSDGFASPEQRRGERITSASDVYSLGCILRKLLRHANAEMEAIVAKACEEQPERRYRTAKELGDDLLRWRQGRAVIAYSSVGAYKLWAWTRRNPAFAAALCLALVSLLAGLVVSRQQARIATAARARAESETRRAEAALLQAEQRRQEAEVARGRAEELRKESQRRYEEMFQLSTSFLADFYEPARAPDFPIAARQWMVRKALDRLTALTRENPRDAKVREALADAYLKVGDLLGNPSHPNLGDAAAAERAYQQAIAILAPMSSPQSRIGLIRLKMRRADLKTLTGQAAEAAKLYTEAAAAWKRLPNIADPETGRGLAVAVMKAAQGEILENKLAPARPKLTDAIAIIRPLAVAEPANSRMQRTLISALSRLAFLDRQMDRKSEAHGALTEAAAVAENAMRRLPDDSDLRQNAAFVYGQLGDLSQTLNDPAAARGQCARGLELMDAELKRDPKNVQVRGTWATVAINFAELLWQQGAHRESIGKIRQAVEIRDDVARSSGAPQLWTLDAARARMTLALRLHQTDESPAALREGRRAAQQLDQIQQRGDFRVNRDHGIALYDFGVILEGAGLAAEAASARRRALAFLEPLAANQARLRPLIADLHRHLSEAP